MMNPVTVGRNIAKYRKEKNMTQMALANILCVSNKAVSKWECGRGLPDKSMFPAILEALGITEEQLCAETALEEENTTAPLQKSAAPAVKSKKVRLATCMIVSVCVLAICILAMMPWRWASGKSPFGFLLTLRGAQFADGSSSTVLPESSDLPNVNFDEEKTFIGWADQDNRYYAESAFSMRSEDTVLSAIYEEDLGDVFTPSCLVENIATGDRIVMEHTMVGANTKATVFRFAHGVAANYGIKILNGSALRNDTCDNTCPIYGDKWNILFMTFANEGTEDLSLQYEIEYFGTLGAEKVTVPAGKIVDLAIPYKSTPDRNDKTAAFHRLIFLNSVSSAVSLTAYGRLYNAEYYDQVQNKYTLSFVGAEYNNMTELSCRFNDFLSADAVLTKDGEKTFVGWKTNRGNVYVSDHDLLENFRMPCGNTVVFAMYAEDMNLYVPSCSYGDKSLRDCVKLTGTHIDNESTTYLLDTSVEEWLIYNGPDEKHNVENRCPVSPSEEYLYYIVLTNDGDKELSLEIGLEYYGYRFPASVVVPAHGSAGVSLRVYGFTSITTFWQINNVAPFVGEAEVTMTGCYA